MYLSKYKYVVFFFFVAAVLSIFVFTFFKLILVEKTDVPSNSILVIHSDYFCPLLINCVKTTNK